jgi:hypothetical protein
LLFEGDAVEAARAWRACLARNAAVGALDLLFEGDAVEAARAWRAFAARNAAVGALDLLFEGDAVEAARAWRAFAARNAAVGALDLLFEGDANETAPPATTAPMVRPEAIRDRERRPMSSSSYSLPLGPCSDRGRSGSLVQADLARQIVGPRTHERRLVV